MRQLSMIRLIFVLFAGLSIFLAGCAQSSGFHVDMEEYPAKDVVPTIAVMPLCEDFIENYDDGNTGPIKLRHNPLEHKFFNQIIGPSIVRAAKARVFYYEKIDLPENISFSKHELSINNKDKLSMFIPDSCRIPVGDFYADYVILFDDYFVDKKFKEEMATIGGTTKTGFPLKIGMNYLIWDNRNTKVAAYGNVSKSLNLMAPPQEETFKWIFSGLAESIILHSRFELRTY